MFGVAEEDFYGAVLRNGCAILFMPRLPPEHAVWMGPIAGTAAPSYGEHIYLCICLSSLFIHSQTSFSNLHECSFACRHAAFAWHANCAMQQKINYCSSGDPSSKHLFAQLPLVIAGTEAVRLKYAVDAVHYVDEMAKVRTVLQRNSVYSC